MLQSSFFRKSARPTGSIGRMRYGPPQNDDCAYHRKTAKRAEALRLSMRAVDEEGHSLNPFCFADERNWDVLAPEHFLYGPVWTTAGGEQRTLFHQRQS